jgi:hypothetical protein
MAFVTVVKGHIGQGCTFALQTVVMKVLVSDCVQYQMLGHCSSYQYRGLSSAQLYCWPSFAGRPHCPSTLPSINPSYGQIPALCSRGSKDRPASERHLWATGLPSSKKTHLLQLGDVVSQFDALDLIYLTLSIYVAAATCQFAIIVRTRYVPFIFMPESSGVGRFFSVLGERSQGHQHLT